MTGRVIYLAACWHALLFTMLWLWISAEHLFIAYSFDTNNNKPKWQIYGNGNETVSFLYARHSNRRRNDFLGMFMEKLHDTVIHTLTALSTFSVYEISTLLYCSLPLTIFLDSYCKKLHGTRKNCSQRVSFNLIRSLVWVLGNGTLQIN